MSSPGRVAVIGSANLDLVVEVARLPYVGETLLGSARGRFPGGKGLNQACAAARTGSFTELCAVVGADEAGDLLQRAATDAGVKGDLLRVEQFPSGVAHILALPDSDNSIVVATGANAHLAAADAERAVESADVVLAQLEVPLPAVAAALRAGRAAGAITILNAAPAHPSAVELLVDVDILVVNETECAELGGLARLCASGVIVVRTLGSRGAELHRPGVPPSRMPAHPIIPVDTTGAGDAFCGALAATLATGASIVEAIAYGSAAGAITAQHLGATTDALTPTAIASLVG